MFHQRGSRRLVVVVVVVVFLLREELRTFDSVDDV